MPVSSIKFEFFYLIIPVIFSSLFIMLFVIRVSKLLEVVEFKLKEVILREPTLLVMMVGVPNVGKSALINSVRQIALSRFAGKMLPYFV